MNSFESMKLSSEITKAIKELGYENPSPIQQQTLPILLGEPTDFIGLAATGTGKTAAFGIPILEQIDATKKAVQAIVICPTRELALQVAGQINLLGKYKGIKALPIYGGAGYDEQMRGLRAGIQIVVGTPGRLTDHLSRRTLNLQDVQTVVLDEADEMISMGFKEDLEKILQATERQSSQIWLFSATMSSEVRKVADTYLENPQQVQVNRTEVLSNTVEQIYYPTHEADKPEILCKIIEEANDFYGLIFCQTKSLVLDLSQYMQGRGYKVETLHGDKSQMERERSMRMFRDRKATIMVCTDVASRGLDVKDVTHVVNYSLPREMDVYVHRIGRTARGGKAGVAISLVTPSHRALIGRIEKMTKSKMTEGKVPTRKDIGIKRVAKVLGQFQEQKFYNRAVELLGTDWKQAIAAMGNEEIVGRFLAMLSPEIFDNQDKPKVSMPGRPASAPRAEGHRGRQDRYGSERGAPRRDRGEYKRSSDRPARSAHPGRPSRPAHSSSRPASSSKPSRPSHGKNPRASH